MLRLHKDKVIMTVVSTVCVFLGVRPKMTITFPQNFYLQTCTTRLQDKIIDSGVMGEV